MNWRLGAVLTLFLAFPIFAHEDLKSPLKLDGIQLTDKKTFLTLDFQGEMQSSGEVTIKLDLPKSFQLKNANIKSIEGRKSKFEKLFKKWEIDFGEDGYYIIEIGIEFKPDPSEQGCVIEYQNFILYVEIRDGKIINYSTTPDPKYTQWPIDANPFPNEIKPPAIYEPDTFFQIAK